MKMKLCRNTREANTGMATNGHCPATKREMYSELENSADVEFQPGGHAVEDVARVVVDQEIEVDAFDLHLAGVERQHAVVEPAGEGQRQLGHRSSVGARFALGCGHYNTCRRPRKGSTRRRVALCGKDGAR